MQLEYTPPASVVKSQARQPPGQRECRPRRGCPVTRDPDHPIAQVDDLDASEEGWTYDESTARLYLKVKHARQRDVLRITF